MNALPSKPPFQPQSLDAAGVIGWVHFGDLHMLEPWPEHGLLGTQLGPNKTGKKW